MLKSYRAKLTLLFFALVSTALGGGTFFILRLYQEDKISSIFESSLNNTAQAASHLENLLLYSATIDLAKVKGSKEIVFLYDQVCHPGESPHGVISDFYRQSLEDFHLSPLVWLAGIDLKQGCDQLALPGADPVLLLPLHPTFFMPYFVALIRDARSERLVMISMDALGGSTEDDLFILTDRHGGIIWANFGDKEVADRLAGNRLVPGDIQRFATDAVGIDLPSVTDRNGDAIVSFAPLLSQWVAMSISSKKTALAPLYFLIEQTIYLLAMFFFICLLFGKFMAVRISGPLSALKDVAEKVGAGDLSARVAASGDAEMRTVQSTFNSMADHLVELVSQTKEKAELDAEMAVAQDVQQMLLPKAVNQLPGHELHGMVKAAAKCGGDWWGFIQAKKSNGAPCLVLLIGDVTGHGVPSALVTAAAQGGMSMLENWIEHSPSILEDPSAILQFFNRAVFHASRGSMQMSFFAVILDTENDLLKSANAGHNWPYLLIPARDGQPAEIRPIGVASPVLGRSLTEKFVNLDPQPWKAGYQLFLYTDGLIDCYDAQETNLYDRRALGRFLKRNSTLQGAGLLKRMMEERATQLNGLTPADDVTAVICTRQGAP